MKALFTSLTASWLTLFIAHAAPPPAPTQDLPVVNLTVGLVIDRSARVKPGVYRLVAKGVDAPALTIRGSNITLDLTGVTIEGGEPYADPDGFHGIGILVDGGRGNTIKGGAVRGYGVGLLGRRSTALHITGFDASYNWKPRLWSGIEKESLKDWLSYHDNEKDEWLRYGAGIYLAECNEAEIDNSRAVQNQNGLLVARAARLKIWNNTVSFNSGLGLGMYRITDSGVSHNRLDWNVRGYSHGFYHRGQDSAALLMYEQTSNNAVGYNSATHGGDGLFLWAGQSTMDTGKGGANDNVFYGNDFSHAVANGIEATFSRNQFVRNRIDDNWHGVWGGYSYDTAFIDNTFSGNDEAIAIEHGQNVTIARNRFSGDQVAIRIWANVSQDPNWGYPKTRDTRSRDYQIDGNSFAGHKTAIDVSRTTGVQVRGNKYDKVGVPVQSGLEVKNLAFESSPAPAMGSPVMVPQMSAGMNAMLPPSMPRGRNTIIVDEWGPYDYLSPKIWPAGKVTDNPLRLRVLGPAGKWNLKAIRGGTASTKAGTVPGELQIAPAGPGMDLEVTLEYVGGIVTTPRGQLIPAGTPSTVAYRLVEPAQAWAVSWWTFDASNDPMSSPKGFAARTQTKPVKTETLPRLDLVSSRALSADLPPDRVAMRAETSLRVPSGGNLQMFVMSDDGVRVWVDGKLLVDRWNVHETAIDRIILPSGNRRIRIEYFEMVGWAELQVRFAR